ncbi:hypothetical protein PN499_19740 [Kamptonema animale CS-326]|nr:hypothetical protein [Kamptonema animale]MDB9513431.1 hypothetical protein [Kamptonema animale CS-326]
MQYRSAYGCAIAIIDFKAFPCLFAGDLRMLETAAAIAIYAIA